jgi:integrase
MSVEKITRKSGEVVWRARWREKIGGVEVNRSHVCDSRRDALDYDAEIRRAKRAGTLALLDAGTETLDEYVTDTWAVTHAVLLAPKTRRHYASLYDHHIHSVLGDVPLRHLKPPVIRRWQAERLAAKGGVVAVRHAQDLLGSILQRAFEDERVAANYVRLVRKPKPPRRKEVRPLAPETVESMRRYLIADGSMNPLRDATLISVLAYSGLRPGEALALRWSDVRRSTILVERAISVGEEDDTKTGNHRSVRMLDPLRKDLLEWRIAAGRPSEDALIFPGRDGRPWSEGAYQSWRRRAFKRALTGAGVASGRPYDLRHSFASLLLHEGRNVIYVARQLGHDARLTLTRYGHVMEEYEDEPRVGAQDAIREARETSRTRLVPASTKASD